MATKPERMKLSDEINFWNILLYADAGAGKTVFGGSDNKVLFLAVEDAGRNSGTISAARQGSTAEKIGVQRWEDVKNTYEWYEDHPEELEDVNVFVIDSMTEMQDLAKKYVLQETREEKIRKDQDPTKLQLQDYGIMHELVETMVRGFNDLPVNVLYTATAKKVEDADANAFLVPDLQGKKEYGVAMKMAALMTCYGYLRVEMHDVAQPLKEGQTEPETKKVKRRVIYWEDTGTIRGKDRLNVLAPFTVNMTLQQLRLAALGKFKRDATGKMVKVEAAQPAKKAAAKAPVKAVAQPSPQPVESTPEAGAPEPKEVKAEELDSVQA